MGEAARHQSFDIFWGYLYPPVSSNIAMENIPKDVPIHGGFWPGKSSSQKRVQRYRVLLPRRTNFVDDSWSNQKKQPPRQWKKFKLSICCNQDQWVGLRESQIWTLTCFNHGFYYYQAGRPSNKKMFVWSP